jgi:hypothetical protein
MTSSNQNKNMLNKEYWVVNSAGCYFDKYAFETIRRDCLDEIETIKFKHPRMCRKMWHQGEKKWRQYLGAGQHCDPELL